MLLVDFDNVEVYNKAKKEYLDYKKNHKDANFESFYVDYKERETTISMRKEKIAEIDKDYNKNIINATDIFENNKKNQPKIIASITIQLKTLNAELADYRKKNNIQINCKIPEIFNGQQSIQHTIENPVSHLLGMEVEVEAEAEVEAETCNMEIEESKSIKVSNIKNSNLKNTYLNNFCSYCSDKSSKQAALQILSTPLLFCPQ
ncbi:MAG: hypothetical protein H2069_07435 [Legionella sp.]|nr:hypothetical protein [Legionella sp.]